MRVAAVRPRIEKCLEASLVQPEKRFLVENAASVFSRRGIFQALHESFVIHRLLVADYGFAMLRMMDGHGFGAMRGFKGDTRRASHFKEIQ